MDFSGLINSIISFAQNNMVITIILALGLLYFLYRKPKLFFVLLFLGLFLVGLYFTVMKMAGSGAAQKKRIIQQEEKKQSD
jgi:hypothetical protein